MSELSVRHLLGIKDLTLDDIELIFETANNFKEIINRPIKKVPSLRDITIANIFFRKLHPYSALLRTGRKEALS